MHPDDRLWRHPSEMARLRAVQPVPPPAPTPGSARQGATSTWVSRIPTSVVIAAGVAAIITSVGGLAVLAYGGATEADAHPAPTFDDQHATDAHTVIVAGSLRAPGVVVDPDGVVVVAIEDPPTRATLDSRGQRAAVTLRSADPHLALAAYQVDAPDPSDAITPAGSIASGATVASEGTSSWAMPTGSSNLGRFELDWVPSTWGPVLAADLGDSDLAPGTELVERGDLVGMTTRTSDGQVMAVPWPVLRSLGARLRPDPLPMGGLPVKWADTAGGPTVAESWGDGDLRTSDRVVAIDGHPVSDVDETEAVAALHPEGETAAVRCERSGKAITVEVTLE